MDLIWWLNASVGIRNSSCNHLLSLSVSKKNDFDTLLKWELDKFFFAVYSFQREIPEKKYLLLT